MNMNMNNFLELFRELTKAQQMYGPYSQEAQHIQYKLEQAWKELSQEEKIIAARNGAHL